MHLSTLSTIEAIGYFTVMDAVKTLVDKKIFGHPIKPNR